jgi:hypothetical protein
MGKKAGTCTDLELLGQMTDHNLFLHCNVTTHYILPLTSQLGKNRTATGSSQSLIESPLIIDLLISREKLSIGPGKLADHACMPTKQPPSVPLRSWLLLLQGGREEGGAQEA